MSKIRAWILRFGGLLNKQSKDRELDAEIESHLQMHIEDNLHSGMNPEEARRQALIKLGGIESTKEAYRDQRGLRWLETLWQDVSYGARMLRKNHGFTAVAMLTLALGIGATTALFSVINTVLLKPLPYPEPGRLFEVWNRSVAHPGDARLLSVPELCDLRERQRTMEGIAAFRNGMANLVFEDGAVRLGFTRVTGNLFGLLGVQPMIGRGFSERDEIGGADRVVVLSHELWRSQFGESIDVLGKTIRLNGDVHTIIGVMPAGFAFPSSGIAMWKPLSFDAGAKSNRGDHPLFAMTRLRHGVSLRQAEDDVRRIRLEVKTEQPGAYPELDQEAFGLTSMLQGTIGTVGRPLAILMGGAFLVLLLACVNVGNLLLVRASVRQKEMAIRLALGAGRTRVFRQWLVEGALLSGLGCVSGLLLAKLGLKSIIALAPQGIPRLQDVRLDTPTILFALTTCAVVAVGISLTPAWKAFQTRLVAPFTNPASRTEPKGWLRLRKLTVTGQIAVAVLLLVSAGLLLETFRSLLREDLGFDTQGILTFKVFPPASDYPGAVQVDQFYAQLAEGIEGLPNVRSVGAVSNIPLYGEWNSVGVVIRGVEGPAGEPDARIDIAARYVRFHYFETMGIRLLRGRLFTAADNRATRPVAVVDERLAGRFWRNEGDALGREILFPGENAPRTIVGVVGSVKHFGPNVGSQPEAYIPQAQSTQRGMFLAVRTSVAPETLTPAIRARLSAINATIPIYHLATENSRLAGIVRQPRFIATLLSLFAVLALTLAAVGTFGVVSYSIRQRTREFGIRFALGAQRREVIQLVLGGVGRLVVAGIAVGIGCAWIATRLMASLLFGVTPLDPATFVVAAAMVASVTLLGCAWPAMLAARVNPSELLRSE